MALGGSPAEFWNQTPATYVVCMEGMVRAASRQVDIATITAHRAVCFYGAAYKGKLGPLSDYISSKRDEDGGRGQNARAIHFFHQLKAKGVPIEIKRVVH